MTATVPVIEDRRRSGRVTLAAAALDPSSESPSTIAVPKQELNRL